MDALRIAGSNDRLLDRLVRHKIAIGQPDEHPEGRTQ